VETKQEKKDTPLFKELREVAEEAMRMLCNTARKTVGSIRTNNYTSTPHRDLPKFMAKLRQSKVGSKKAGINLFNGNFQGNKGHWKTLVRLCEYAAEVDMHPMRSTTKDIFNFIMHNHGDVGMGTYVGYLSRYE
jgi:hypothetical protein